VLATELEAACASLKNEAQGARERLARLEKRLLVAERARVRAETAVRRDVAGAEVGGEVGGGCVHASVFRADVRGRDVRGRRDGSGVERTVVVERIFVRMHVPHASCIDQVFLHAGMCVCTCICICTHAFLYAHMSIYRHVDACMCACVWQITVDPEKFRALVRRGDVNELIAVYQMLQEQVLLCLLACACTACICVHLVRSLSPSRVLSVSRSQALSLCTSSSHSLSLPPSLPLSLALSLSRSLPPSRTPVSLSPPLSVFLSVTLSVSRQQHRANDAQAYTSLGCQDAR